MVNSLWIASLERPQRDLLPPVEDSGAAIQYPRWGAVNVHVSFPSTDSTVPNPFLIHPPVAVKPHTSTQSVELYYLLNNGTVLSCEEWNCPLSGTTTTIVLDLQINGFTFFWRQHRLMWGRLKLMTVWKFMWHGHFLIFGEFFRHFWNRVTVLLESLHCHLNTLFHLIWTLIKIKCCFFGNACYQYERTLLRLVCFLHLMP